MDLPIALSTEVGLETKEPIVVMHLLTPQGEYCVKMVAEEARHIGLMFLEASDASLSDSFIVDFLMNQIQVQDMEKIAWMLQEFRQYRAGRKLVEQIPETENLPEPAPKIWTPGNG